MQVLAESIIDRLLETGELFEDRFEDMVAKFGAKIPGSTPQAKRQTLEQWAEFDPSRNKKYFPWMFKQFLANKVVWDHQNLDNVRDALMDFEHYITMPAFEEPRDIFQYDVNTLTSTLAKYRGRLISKADRERGSKRVQANVINRIGDLELLGFKDGKSIAEESWRAYSPENPNWTDEPHQPTDPEYNQGPEPYSVDHLWCTRNPQRGADYAKNSPSKTFYVIRKGGWPYMAAVLSSSGSQIMDLHNHGINVGQAEQIYPLMKPVIDEYAKNKWQMGHSAENLFSQIRIVRGEIQPGETIRGVDLSGSSIKTLPDDLTVSGNLSLADTKIARLPNNLNIQGDLNISNTAISELPPGLKVSGGLKLSGTKISALPDGMSIGTLDISNTPITQLPPRLEIKQRLNIAGTPIVHLPNDLVLAKTATVEYSEPLSKEEIKRYFFFLRLQDLKATYFSAPEQKSLTPEQKEVGWQKFMPKLQKHFQEKDKTVEKAIASLFKLVHARK